MKEIIVVVMLVITVVATVIVILYFIIFNLTSTPQRDSASANELSHTSTTSLMYRARIFADITQNTSTIMLYGYKCNGSIATTTCIRGL